MRSCYLFLLIFVSIILTGCPSIQPRYNHEKFASISQVLNLVKDELNAFSKAKPNKYEPGECNTDLTSFIPSKVSVTLQTVVLQTNEPSAGVALPLGVVTLDPSYNGSYSQKRTQTLEVSLGIKDLASSVTKEDLKSNTPLALAMYQFRDEILKTNHDKPCFEYSKENKSTLKLKLQFDVVNKSTGGFSLKITPFQFGHKYTDQNETHHTLDIEFSLKDGSVMNHPTPPI